MATRRAQARSPAALALALALAAGACSASPQLPELEEAEHLEREGHHEAALEAYERAATTCRAIGDGDRRRARCGEAHLHRAELLERLQRQREAADAYLEVPRSVDEPQAAARATYNAGRIFLELGESEAGYDQLWLTITEYPNQLAAADAVKLLRDDGRRRAPRELYGVFRQLWSVLPDAEVAPHLTFAMAEIAEEDLGDPRAALELYDEIAESYPDSPLYDDALWRGGGLARELGDPRGAIRRYRELEETRDKLPLGFGVARSPHLDDALLETARVLRDDLGEPDRAIEALRTLPEEFPDSRLHDDALFERGLTWAEAGRPDRACTALAHLAEAFPDSRYELERAPALRDDLACNDE